MLFEAVYQVWANLTYHIQIVVCGYVRIRRPVYFVTYGDMADKSDQLLIAVSGSKARPEYALMAVSEPVRCAVHIKPAVTKGMVQKSVYPVIKVIPAGAFDQYVTELNGALTVKA